MSRSPTDGSAEIALNASGGLHAENHVRTELPAKLLPERCTQVDLRQYAESLLLERLPDARHCDLEGKRHFDVESQFFRHIAIPTPLLVRRRPGVSYV